MFLHITVILSTISRESLPHSVFSFLQDSSRDTDLEFTIDRRSINCSDCEISVVVTDDSLKAWLDIKCLELAKFSPACMLEKSNSHLIQFQFLVPSVGLERPPVFRAPWSISKVLQKASYSESARNSFVTPRRSRPC